MATRTRGRTEADKERFAEQRREQLEALQQQIVDASTRLVEGDQWQAWLRFAGTFHSYSFGNQLLIMLARPDASLAAGYRAWQAKGRQVRKGETGIRILAPVLARADMLDQAGNPVLDDNGKPKKASKIIGVKPTSTFDISQTDGEPAPEPPRPQLLKGEAPEGLWDSLAGLIEDRGYRVQRGDCGTANGITHFGEHTVTVRPDVDDLQALKTLIHEGGHVLLHEPETRNMTDSGELCRGRQEVEAESVAYLVACAHGLDTSDYSFAYVASWATTALQQADEGVTLADIITSTGQRVVRAAHTILDVTQPAQALDEATSALAAGVTAQIAEDRQTIPETATAPPEVEVVTGESRVQVREPAVQAAAAVDSAVITAGWDDEERLARAMLSTVIEPGDPTVLAALREAGDAATLVATLRGAREGQLPPGWQQRLFNVSPESLVALAGHHGMRFIMPADAEWPATLNELTGRPPLNGVEGPSIGLWVAGDHRLNEFLTEPITITGARASTDYGNTVAADLAQQLSTAGHTIVSSGGQGIDAAVHRAVAAAGGRALVVHPGINSPLPLGHWELNEHLAAGNMMTSEIGPRPVGRRDYLTSARILAAVSHSTVVVEASARGSALTTAAWSKHLDRPTMAVPGPATSAMSTGCHTLIRDRQADLVTTAEQVTAALSPSPTREPEPAWQKAAAGALQNAAAAPSRRRVVEVFKEYDSVHHDDFAQAHDAAQRVAAAGVIGAVHSVRTYDPSSIMDGEIEYLTQAHETVVFANQSELDRWADINGLRTVEGRNDNDIMTSIDPYQHHGGGYLEVHDLHIQRPAAPTAAVAPTPDREIGRQTVQDVLSAAFPAAAKAPIQPLAAAAGRRSQAAHQGTAPAMER